MTRTSSQRPLREMSWEIIGDQRRLLPGQRSCKCPTSNVFGETSLRRRVNGISSAALGQKWAKISKREVMEYAEAMTQTPPTVTDELSATLLKALGPAALVELTMFIGLANLMAAPMSRWALNPRDTDVGAAVEEGGAWTQASWRSPSWSSREQ